MTEPKKNVEGSIISLKLVEKRDKWLLIKEDHLKKGNNVGLEIFKGQGLDRDYICYCFKRMGIIKEA